jgi:hypothetical protein
MEDEKQVYLSTDALPKVSTKTVDYIRRDLPPGRKSDYIRITCQHGSEAFSLTCARAGPWWRISPKSSSMTIAPSRRF